MLTLLLFLNLCCFCSGVPFSVLSFDCDANPKACTHNLCRVRTLRSKATVIDFMCYHPYPIKSAELHIAIKKKNPQLPIAIFEFRDDICKFYQKGRASLFLTRFLEEIKKYGGAGGCPLYGNLTLFGFPVATALQYVLPMFLPPGMYQLVGNMTDLINNVLIFNSTMGYVVK